jgi:hypothetical protein
MKASDAEKLDDLSGLKELAQLSPPGQGEDHGHDSGHDHGHGLEAVRQAEHRGHRIVIKTCYEITVDGQPVTTHLSLGNDGTLRTHAMPNYAFSSAVDLVKKIIDLFPDEFTSSHSGDGHGGHSHEHH